jgi:hypothetical protein
LYRGREAAASSYVKPAWRESMPARDTNSAPGEGGSFRGSSLHDRTTKMLECNFELTIWNSEEPFFS